MRACAKYTSQKKKCLPVYTTKCSQELVLWRLSSFGVIPLAPLPDWTARFGEPGSTNIASSSDCARRSTDGTAWVPLPLDPSGSVVSPDGTAQLPDGIALPSGLQTMVSMSTIDANLVGGGRMTRDLRSSGRSGQAPSCRHSTSASWRIGSSCIFFDRLLICWDVEESTALKHRVYLFNISHKKESRSSLSHSYSTPLFW